MSHLSTLLSKALRLGPLPYFGLFVVIVVAGAVAQMRMGHVGEGATIFGTAARIGGVVGLFGLLPLIVGSAPGSERHRDSPVPKVPRPIPGALRRRLSPEQMTAGAAAGPDTTNPAPRAPLRMFDPETGAVKDALRDQPGMGSELAKLGKRLGRLAKNAVVRHTLRRG